MQTILDGSMKNDYPLMIQQAEALTADERLVLPNLANTAALLGESLSEINWAGYYLLREDVLILGPFWGRPACIRIPMGKGVCGTAAAEDRVLCVPDVSISLQSFVRIIEKNCDWGEFSVC